MHDSDIHLHSMFRTGSTFLAARFAADPRCLLFYEPFHGDLLSARRMARALDAYEAKRRVLRHEAIDGGYFGAFERIDPASGRPLRTLARSRFSVHDVLNDLHASGAAYLAACARAAAAEGRHAAFGFCRSGLQVGAMRRVLPGRHVHLWRDPRQQFASFAPGRNDYFLSQTVLQLLASRRLAPIALALGQLPRHLPSLVRAASRALPPPAVARLGRRLAAGLAADEGYALFYLGWLACFEHARAHTELSFSLSEALSSPARRAEIEAVLGVGLDGLRQIDRPEAPTAIDHAGVERRVEAALGASPAGASAEERSLIVG